MIVLRRTPNCNPTVVHIVQNEAAAMHLLVMVRNSHLLGIDLEYHAAIPTAPVPPSLQRLAHRRLARSPATSPSLFSRTLAKAARHPFTVPIPIVQKQAWPSLQVALPPSHMDTASGASSQCTNVFVVPLSPLEHSSTLEAWCLALIRQLFSSGSARHQHKAGQIMPTLVFHGGRTDLAVLRSRFNVAPHPDQVVDLQALYNRWASLVQSSGQKQSAVPSSKRPSKNPNLNDLLAFLGLPTNPFKSNRTADLIAYAAYDVDQLIPAYHALQRLLLDRDGVWHRQTVS